MDDPDIAWTIAAYLASGGSLPDGGGVDVVDHLGHKFSMGAGGGVTVTRGPCTGPVPAPPGRAREAGRACEPYLDALRAAAGGVDFTVRRASMPYPLGDVDLIEPDDPGLPVVALGDGAWLLHDDGPRPVRCDGDLAQAVASDFADSVGERRRCLGM